MEKPKKTMILVAVTVIACLFVTTAIARRYDTMMVGYDRWIDINYEGEPNEIVDNAPADAYEISYIDEDPNTVYLLGDPNFLSEHPTEHPNSVYINLDPNNSFIAEHPNSIKIGNDANLVEIPEEVVWNQNQ